MLCDLTKTGVEHRIEQMNKVREAFAFIESHDFLLTMLRRLMEDEILYGGLSMPHIARKYEMVKYEAA